MIELKEYQSISNTVRGLHPNNFFFFNKKKQTGKGNESHRNDRIGRIQHSS